MYENVAICWNVLSRDAI